MFPYLTIFGHELPVYGVMAVLGLFAGIIYLRLAVGRSVPADAELAVVWGAVGCFVGAKALYILTALPEIYANWDAILAQPGLFAAAYLSGGFVFYGGLYGAIAGAYIYCRASLADFDAVARLVLPIVPLIHGFGRIGCFCTGCCYGVESDALGIAFQNSPVAPNGVRLLPVQLIEATAVFALFIALASMYRRGFRGRSMLGAYLASYSVVRFILEFFRGDAYRGFILSLSISQVVAAVSVVFGIALLARSGASNRRRA